MLLFIFYYAHWLAQRYPKTFVNLMYVIALVLAQISPSRVYRIQARRQWHCDGGARDRLVTWRNTGKSYVLCKRSH